MTSKELNEILNKTRRTPDISLTPKQVKELIKDLEQKELLEIELKLEKHKVKYAMKQLKKQDKILEIIKKWSFLDTFYREDTDTTYDRFLCNIHTKGMKEDFEKVKEWLDDK